MTIVTWFRDQRKDFGTSQAVKLLLRVLSSRAYVLTLNKLLPAKLMCPCCGWEGRRFLDYQEIGYTVPNCACPSCDSHPRHRLLFLWLANTYDLTSRKGIALVFAPEPCLANLWKSATGLHVIKVDLESKRSVDVLADIMSLPFDTGVARLVWCHHVIEQVVEDRRALAELKRVLSPDGELIISSGMSDRDVTVEFGDANKAASGNRRSFGADYPQRLEGAGFTVELLAQPLTTAEQLRYRVNPEPFYRCTIP